MARRSVKGLPPQSRQRALVAIEAQIAQAEQAIAEHARRHAAVASGKDSRLSQTLLKLAGARLTLLHRSRETLRLGEAGDDGQRSDPA